MLSLLCYVLTHFWRYDMDKPIKQWDWVRFAGTLWRVCFIENGWATLCNERQKKDRIHIDQLTRDPMSDVKFSDPYPYE